MSRSKETKQPKETTYCEERNQPDSTPGNGYSEKMTQPEKKALFREKNQPEKKSHSKETARREKKNSIRELAHCEEIM